MPSSINLDNGGEFFNIFLDADGNLNFKANDLDGRGNTRVSINDESGTVFIGGSGRFGAIQLLDPNGAFVTFLGPNAAVNVTKSRLFLGGGGGLSGEIGLFNAQSANTIDMQGSNGTIRCTDLTTTSDVRLKKGIAPLLNALDKVLAMRGVRYQSKQEDSPKEAFGEDSQIGFIAQEMETVCPEIVSTDAEGYKSISYSRLIPVLVEAIKEQQQLIQRQASALQEAVEKIARIETAMDAS